MAARGRVVMARGADCAPPNRSPMRGLPDNITSHLLSLRRSVIKNKLVDWGVRCRRFWLVFRDKLEDENKEVFDRMWLLTFRL